MNKAEIIDELIERFEFDDLWEDFISLNRNKSVDKIWEALLDRIEIADNGKIDSLDYIFDNFEELHEEYKNG